jgi:hypothetical protein
LPEKLQPKSLNLIVEFFTAFFEFHKLSGTPYTRSSLKECIYGEKKWSYILASDFELRLTGPLSERAAPRDRFVCSAFMFHLNVKSHIYGTPCAVAWVDAEKCWDAPSKFTWWKKPLGPWSDLD